MVRKFHALLAAALLSSFAVPGLAITPEQKDKVRQLVKEGGQLLQSGRHAEARDQLMAALSLAPVPAIALYAGTAHEHLHELVRAAQLYRWALDMPLDETLWDGEKSKTAFQLRSREQARTALRQLLERSATIRIQVVGQTEGTFQVTLDGVALDAASLVYDQPVPSGSHVVAVVQGNRRLSQTVLLERTGMHSAVTFDLTQPMGTVPAVPAVPASPRVAAAPPLPKRVYSTTAPSTPPESSSTHDVLTWSAFGAGAAGLGTGILAGLVTLGKRSDLLAKGCSSDGNCPRDGQIDADELNGYNAWRAVTTVGFIVGAVGVATGVTLSLTRPKKGEVASRTVVYVATGSVGAHGSF